MPKTTKSGSAKQSELPSTLQRSPKKAQRTFAKAHDSAAGEYGDEKRANQVAWAAVKHSFEKIGDHWERKNGGKKGPSDAQAAGGRNTNREQAGRGRTEHEQEDGGRRRRERHQGPPAHGGQEARHLRPLADEEEATGRGDPEGEQQEDGVRPQEQVTRERRRPIGAGRRPSSLPR